MYDVSCAIYIVRLHCTYREWKVDTTINNNIFWRIFLFNLYKRFDIDINRTHALDI